MILLSLLALALYVVAVAPLASLVLEPLRPLDLGRRNDALRAPPALNPAAQRDLELRVHRRLYPGHRISIDNAAA